jgi:hypothetical protein
MFQKEVVDRMHRFCAKSAVLVIALALFGLGVAAPSFAQSPTTILLGTVTDKNGGGVANAQVTATNIDTNLVRTAPTNDEGEYRFEFLPLGNYKVEVAAPGFKKFVRTGVVLEVGVTARADARLDVGDVSQSVIVTAEAPQVNTSTTDVGRLVENKEIVDLPIVNRNVYALLSLTPGVESNANSIVLGYPEQRTLINGGVDGGAGSVSYYLDGGINMTGLRNTGNILPNPDAIQEFQVETSNFNAQFGKMSGGVVTVVTKSGTNDWHGSLYDFYRDTALNANVWNNTTGFKPPVHRNQYGATVGGPIRKDKDFFFFSYQGLRQISSTFLNGAIVPTLAERAGNFSGDAAIKDPIVNGPNFTTTGFIIPSSVLDPTAVYIINNFIPKPNVGTNKWDGVVSNPYNGDDFLAKWDHSLTSKQRLTVSYFETSGNNSIPEGSQLPWSVQSYTWRQQNLNASDTWTLTPAVVNQTWLTYTRNFGGRTNTPDTSLGALSSEAGGTGTFYNIQGTPSLPQLAVSGDFTLTQGIAGPLAGTNYYSLRDIASSTHGRHTIAFGAELSLDKDIQQTLLDNYGVFTFSGSGKQSTGNALADFELGLPSAMEQDSPITPYTNSWNLGVFVQDDFRVYPNLTFNLGLRWDLQTPPTDPLNRESSFEVGVQSIVDTTAPLGELFPGDPGITRGIVPIRWNHVSPRIGLAWDPFGDGKTAVRIGGGMFWGSVSGNEWNTTSNFVPFAIRLTTFANVGTPPTLNGSTLSGGPTLTNPYNGLPSDPFPYTGQPVAGASIFGVSPDFQWPKTYQTNVSIQRQITSDFSMTVAFVGEYTRNLPFATDLNYPTPCSLPVQSTCSGSGASVLSRRLIDTGLLGSVYQLQSNQRADYNGLQITASKKMAHHLMLNAFYVYSKTLESVELQNNTTNPTAAGQVPQDYQLLSAEGGRADDDMRHQFVTSLVWQPDYYHGSSKLVSSVINGWSFSPIVTFHSGLPFTVVSGKDQNLDGSSANDRPDLVMGVSPVLPANRTRAQEAAEWFNTAAFYLNPSGTNGDVGRNTLDAPGFKEVDMAIFRDFKIHERMSLQARLEATNSFNWVNLNTPAASGPPATIGATPASASFGTITSSFAAPNTTGPSRQVQLGLRLTF